MAGLGTVGRVMSLDHGGPHGGDAAGLLLVHILPGHVPGPL